MFTKPQNIEARTEIVGPTGQVLGGTRFPATALLVGHDAYQVCIAKPPTVDYTGEPVRDARYRVIIGFSAADGLDDVHILINAPNNKAAVMHEDLPTWDDV